MILTLFIAIPTIFWALDDGDEDWFSYVCNFWFGWLN